MKSDIYAMGVVLLESISGRRAFDPNLPEGQQNLVEWSTLSQSNRRNVKEIIDPRLEHNYPLHGVSECVSLALKCVANKPKNRPSSEEVWQRLRHIYAIYK
ncbi:putative transferase [Helianthus annuus]|nr:putative transferase [Helianthus annuus]